MTEPPIDPSVLAAFLDGTATDAERAAVLQSLATDREQLTRFAEAAQARAALDGSSPSDATNVAERRMATTAASEAPPPVAVVHTTMGAPRVRRLLAPLALAAALIAVVVLTRSATQRATPAPLDVLQVARLVEVPVPAGNGAVERALGRGTVDPAWSVTRGATDTTRTVSARAYRAGVRMAQLELAIQAQDTTAARTASAGLTALLREIEGAAPIAAAFGTTVGGAAWPEATTRATLTRQVRGLTHATPWFDLGAWTESARHAAHRSQSAFFAPTGVPMSTLRSVLADTTAGTGWREATAPLRVLVAQPATASLDSVLQALDLVVRAAGD